MIVLVVDDQINVVNGIVSGVDWASAGVSKVLHAYNATMHGMFWKTNRWIFS